MIEEIKEFASILNTPKINKVTQDLINDVLQDMVTEYRTVRAQPVKVSGNDLVIPKAIFDEWTVEKETGGV